MKRLLALSLFPLTLMAAVLSADTVVTTDGSRLTGKIVLIDEGTIHLETSYAGTIKIKQEQVSSFETSEPMFVRLESGAVMRGPVQRGTGDTLRVLSSDGTLETNVSRVKATWQPEATDPEIVRREEELAKLSRRWVYEAAFDVLGKSGNTSELGVGASFNATLKSPNDSLRFYIVYENREQNDTRSADRIAGGAEYENFFSEHFGWYVRTQLETDRVRQYDLRSTTAGGLSYRLINTERQSLNLRSGIAYEYTTYTTDRASDSEAVLDLGLTHRLRINDHLLMRNSLSFLPTLDDFGDFRAVHESSIEFPVGRSSFWTVRSGILNEYESRPAAAKKMDTTYFSRMVLRWE